MILKLISDVYLIQIIDMDALISLGGFVDYIDIKKDLFAFRGRDKLIEMVVITDLKNCMFFYDKDSRDKWNPDKYFKLIRPVSNTIIPDTLNHRFLSVEIKR